MISSPIGRIAHSSTLYLIRDQVQLAERIARHSGIADARVFFVNSGSEAVETALLLATARARSNQVLALWVEWVGRNFTSGIFLQPTQRVLVFRHRLVGDEVHT